MSNHFLNGHYGHLDLADSSSDSDDAVHYLNDDVAVEDTNSLKNNVTNDGDTESLGSREHDADINEVAAMTETDDFKTEWTDTFMIPIGYLQSNGKVANKFSFTGAPHRWKNIDWTTLLQFEGLAIGAYIGVDNSHQIPPGCSMHLRYQYLLLDERDEVVLEGPSNSTLMQRSITNARVDNGYAITFNNIEFLKHLRKTFAAMRSPGALTVPVRVKLMVEEEFRPTLVPVGHNSKRDTGMVGLENLGATCYLNALLQMLYHINGFRRAVYKLPHEGEAISSSTTLALQNVFRNLQTSDREVTTKELTVAFGWTSAEAFLQQDVQEMMRVLVDKLEEKMTGTVVDGYIKYLMAGKVRSFICCVNVQYESKRAEDYYDIQLDVKGCKDIYQSFRKYTEIEMLDGENQYEAGEHGKQDAKKGVTFESFPPVLTIHLKRFDFDIQTMNFTKIHDYFEFPLRLELDQFLAPDCPEESRQQPNVYLLHSVLVHQGDVGGGHYYAYIRPTTKTFDYTGRPFIGSPGEPVRVAGRDQQWFKFNDETVLQVPQREAVDYCYGRRIKESEFLRSMSSAYMLVYIRESDAPGIMREVTPEDIPEELGERLDTEQAVKRAKHMRVTRSRWFNSISFATEKQLAEFKDYSRFQDFISEKALISAECMRDSNKLAVLLLLAEKLQRTPADLRLWEIEKRENCPTLGVSDDIDWDELTHRVKEPRFYVEYVDFLGTAEERIQYEQEYLDLRQAEAKLLSELRDELRRIEDLHYADNEDPVAGCGIGCGNLPLNDLKLYNSEMFDFYSTAFEDLQAEMMTLLKPHYRDIRPDQMLTFIKVYDPYNYLSIAGPAESSDESSLQSLSSGESDSDMDTVDPEEADGESVPGPPGASPGQRILAMRPKAKAAEYMPVKYLGSSVVGLDDELATLAHVVDHLVRRANPDFPPGWQGNCTRFRYYESEGPTRCRPIPQKSVDDLRLTFREAKVEMNAVLIYVDILPEQPGQMLVPYSFTDVMSWLSYRAYKKVMQIRPFDQHEVRILLKRQRERLERQRAAAMDVESAPTVGTSDSQATAALSPPGSVHGTPNSAKRRPLQLRDRTSSIGSQQRDRANSLASELGMSPSRAAQPLNLKALSGKAFTVEVPLLAYTKLLIRRVAQMLDVEPAHLVLFIVSPSGPDWVSDKFDVEPVSLAHPAAQMKLLEALKLLKLSFKASAKYCVFYRIVPYPLVDSRGVDLRTQYKFTDYLIVDERIRYWRALFLEHLRVSAASGNADISAGAAAADIANAAEGSTPKRSRTNSEGRHGSDVTNRPREASIRWPDAPKPNEYDLLELEQVTTCIPSSYTMREIVEFLRGAVGIPKNFRELDALKYADSPGRSAQQTEVAQLLRVPAVRAAVVEGAKATCTDDLKVTGEGEIVPAFPLLVSVVRYNTIDQVLGGSCTMFVECRSEATVPVCNLFTLALQHVTAEEAVFMRNRHPRVRSMILSVFSFKLAGRNAIPLECREYPQGGGPFLSYVRQDDTYQSLARRLAVITGDSREEWWNMRLAISIPHNNGRKAAVFLPQTSSTDVTAGDVSAGVETKEGDAEHSAAAMDEAGADDEEAPHTPRKEGVEPFIGPAPGTPTGPTADPAVNLSLWDIFCQHFPEHNAVWGGSDGPTTGMPPIPLLGIQRSVADVIVKTRLKRAGGGGIKIV